MSKKEEAEGFYDDGLIYMFKADQPKHLRFEIQTGTQEGESCNLRLTTLRELSAGEVYEA